MGGDHFTSFPFAFARPSFSLDASFFPTAPFSRFLSVRFSFIPFFHLLPPSLSLAHSLTRATTANRLFCFRFPRPLIEFSRFKSYLRRGSFPCLASKKSQIGKPRFILLSTFSPHEESRSFSLSLSLPLSLSLSLARFFHVWDFRLHDERY